ncbi:three-helix bundle dimerization domain-containing protein [Streptomyces klenkii]|uniref:three-helix bundle dimerization domain-containing protein n=1 Tax=Streptomyces klenkii TaxID=1420899 RepID=UPI0036EA98D1
MDGQSASSPDTDRQEHERRELAALTERLTSRYSTLPASVVEAAVRTAEDSMRDARIRDYVLIFVERRARAALDQRVKNSI